MEAFAGRYRLIDLIGTGGMGSVWRAWDLRRSKYVAAKVLGQHDAATLLRFVREQSLRIQHPHVVAPHGWAADDDKVVFAMDLVRGGSVATLLGDHGPLPAPYVAVLLDQLLRGLSAVHAASVVHRDVKPANLLLDVTGTGRPYLRLSDFGVAGLLDEPRMTRHSTILGTPGYLAPEQLAGADPDPRQDLYAVGVVAAELLTGERPGSDSQLTNPGGPLGGFIGCLTAADPSDRPDSATSAGGLLAATGTVPPPGIGPWARTPDPPEVFDQLPPLPPHWTPAGPRNTQTPVPAVPTPPGALVEPSVPIEPVGQPAPIGSVEQRAPGEPVGQRAPIGPVGQRAPIGPVGQSALIEPVGQSAPSEVAAPGASTGRAAGGVPGRNSTGHASVSAGDATARRSSRTWILRAVAATCFVGAVGLLGSAAWFAFR